MMVWLRSQPHREIRRGGYHQHVRRHRVGYRRESDWRCWPGEFEQHKSQQPEGCLDVRDDGGNGRRHRWEELANPVALIDAAAEMLLHIGGKANILGAELIKTAVLEVLADGHYVGDIKKGPFQISKGRDRSGTREFAAEIAER